MISTNKIDPKFLQHQKMSGILSTNETDPNASTSILLASGLLILKGFHLSLDFKDDKIRLTGFYSVFNLFLVSYAQQKCVICLEFRFWKYHSHELFKSLYRTWRTKSLSCLFFIQMQEILTPLDIRQIIIMDPNNIWLAGGISSNQSCKQGQKWWRHHVLICI